MGYDLSLGVSWCLLVSLGVSWWYPGISWYLWPNLNFFIHCGMECGLSSCFESSLFLCVFCVHCALQPHHGWWSFWSRCVSLVLWQFVIWLVFLGSFLSDSSMELSSAAESQESIASSAKETANGLGSEVEGSNLLVGIALGFGSTILALSCCVLARFFKCFKYVFYLFILFIS